MAGGALTASAARAEVLEFDLAISDANSDYATWTQSDAPTPMLSNFETTRIPVGNPSSSLGTFSIINFDSSGFHGGLRIYTTDDQTLLFWGVGPQIFGGSVAAPTFAPETIDLTPIISYSGDSVTLTITAVPVPEPASWTLMIVGIGGLGAALRATRRSRLVAQAA